MDTNNSAQSAKADLFHKLHQKGGFLLLTNIWDPLGALLVKDLGYPAIATASASIAYSNGYLDGEQIPFDKMLEIIKSIVQKTDLPVTVDLESGYATGLSLLAENMKRMIETGIAGINMEDYNHSTKTIYTIEEQCERLECIKKVCRQMGVHVFVNARADAFLKGPDTGTEVKIDEIIKRGKAYTAAGADGFFPIGLVKEGDIRKVVEAVDLPLNILAISGVCSLDQLKEMGVRRVSLGPGLLKIAIKAMKEVLVKLEKGEGLEMVTENEITSGYLQQLM